MNIVSAFQALASDQRSIQSVKEISVKKFSTPAVDNFFTVVPNIKGGLQVAGMRTLEYITTLEDGCGGTSLTPSFPAISQTWNPRRAKINIKLCYQEFEAKFTQWALGNGYDVHNLQEAEFFDFIIFLVYDGMQADALRLILLGDQDIAAQNILTNPAKAPYYNIIDKGLIPTLQYFKTIPSLAGNFVDLPQNSETDPVDQMTLNGEVVYDSLNELMDDADFTANQLISSNTLATAYKKFLRSWTLESSKDQIQKGVQSLPIDGKELKPIKDYDRWVREDFKSTTTDLIHIPHFALYANKEILQVGVDSVNALEDLRFEYVGGSDEHFYIKGNYMIDFKIVNPYEFRALI